MVPHRRLLYKLNLDYYGIRGSTHKWISSWRSEHSQKVVLDGQASDPVPVLSVVPQGSVLGPGERRDFHGGKKAILKNRGLILNPWANMWCPKSFERAIKFVL